MIIVVPSCLKDADGALTRSDQFLAPEKNLDHFEGIGLGQSQFLIISRLRNCTILKIYCFRFWNQTSSKWCNFWIQNSLEEC